MPEPNEILNDALKQIDENLKKPLEQLLDQLQGKFPFAVGKIEEQTTTEEFEIVRMEGGIIYLKCKEDATAKRIYDQLK